MAPQSGCIYIKFAHARNNTYGNIYYVYGEGGLGCIRAARLENHHQGYTNTN